MNGVPGIPLHINPADLRASAGVGAPQITPAASDSPEAFLQAARLWLERWVAKHGDTVKTVPPFAIACEPQLGSGRVRAQTNYAPVYMFREELPLTIGGNIFVTTTSMQNVEGRVAAAKTISELATVLIADGLGAEPCLVVNAAEGYVVVCQGGVNGQRYQATLNMHPIVDLTEALIDEELEKFHADYTQFPSGLAHVFHDRKARVLLRKAEDIVRDNLFQHLQFRAFGSKLIIREGHTSAGRTDITIIDSQQNNRVACVIELKVLRSRGLARRKDGTIGSREYRPEVMVEHARMGVRQAEKYKKIADPNALWGYVCLFDGRDKDEDLPDVQKVAGERGILYRRYYMEENARVDLVI